MKNDRIENEYIMWGRKEVFVQSAPDSSLSRLRSCGRGSPTRSGRTREDSYDNQNDIPVRSLHRFARWSAGRDCDSRRPCQCE